MIELTDQQIQALETPEAAPPRFVNPRTRETFVLLRVEEYERLTQDEYDDSPWTREELQALAWEAGKEAAWEDMDEDDKPRLREVLEAGRQQIREGEGVRHQELWEGPPLTKAAFFADPNYHYYLGGRPIPDEWIAEAWEELPKFRDNVTYEFVREASKVGDLDAIQSSLEFLDGILPLHRMVEIYERVRACSPTREPEFRPSFERVFGERMSAFPAPLPQAEYEVPSSPYGVPDSSVDDDDEIPF